MTGKVEGGKSRKKEKGARGNGKGKRLKDKVKKEVEKEKFTTSASPEKEEGTRHQWEGKMNFKKFVGFCIQGTNQNIIIVE